MVDAWKDQPATHSMDGHRYYTSHEFMSMNPDGSLGTKTGIVSYGR